MTQNKITDWQHCRTLWQEMMRIEAADRGYDFEAANAASKAYYAAGANYRQAHDESFDPYTKPEDAATSVHEMIAEADEDSILGLARSIKVLSDGLKGDAA